MEEPLFSMDARIDLIPSDTYGSGSYKEKGRKERE